MAREGEVARAAADKHPKPGTYVCPGHNVGQKDHLERACQERLVEDGVVEHDIEANFVRLALLLQPVDLEAQDRLHPAVVQGGASGEVI